MKLQDPGLEALLEAYRADRRPTEAMREQLWQRFEASRRPPRAWVRATIVAAVAVAALLLLWLSIRELSGEVARARGPASGSQAPFDRSAGSPRGTASNRAERPATAAGTPPGTPPEPTAAVAPPLTDPTLEHPVDPRTSDDRPRPTRPTERPSAHAAEPPPPSPSDDLALVEAAEAALQAGEPERALELLHRHEQRFPRAATVEEREALRVLALCAAGRVVEGRGARWTFLREHPRSAYRERIEKACPAA